MEGIRLTGCSTTEGILRVFVCGCHSVGKTTLVKEVSRQTSLHEEAEVARKVIAKLGLKRDDFDPQMKPQGFRDLQERIIREQAIVERVNSSQGRSYIADRGIDPVVYAGMYLGQQQAEYLLNLNETKESIKRYQSSLIFVIKPFPECICGDGVRLQPKMDELLRFTVAMETLLAGLQIPYTFIDVLNLQQRVDIIKQRIDGWVAINNGGMNTAG